MAQQNGRGRTCVHCLETDHSASECALAPASRAFRQPEYNRDYSTEERSYRRSEQTEKICYSWNDGRCAILYCRYKHVCVKCQSGDHKAVSCPIYPTPKQGSQGVKPTSYLTIVYSSPVKLGLHNMATIIVITYLTIVHLSIGSVHHLI